MSIFRLLTITVLSLGLVTSDLMAGPGSEDESDEEMPPVASTPAPMDTAGASDTLTSETGNTQTVAVRMEVDSKQKKQTRKRSRSDRAAQVSCMDSSEFLCGAGRLGNCFVCKVSSKVRSCILEFERKQAEASEQGEKRAKTQDSISMDTNSEREELRSLVCEETLKGVRFLMSEGVELSDEAVLRLLQSQFFENFRFHHLLHKP